MYDTLTLDELYDLHSRLSDEHKIGHERLMGRSGPKISTFSDEWAVLDARQAELSETLNAVFAEIKLRDKENFEETVITEAIYRGFGGTDA